MFAHDGNNSLKRSAALDGRQVGDRRVFEGSDYFLSEDYVNQYADEVKARTSSENDPEPSPSEDPENVIDGDIVGGDPTDGTADPAPCADNWKAAAAAERKRMWSVFEETGIFASACRHGLILWIADIIRCGEL